MGELALAISLLLAWLEFIRWALSVVDDREEDREARLVLLDVAREEADDEARIAAAAKPTRLTRAEVERVLASVPPESSLVLRRELTSSPEAIGRFDGTTLTIGGAAVRSLLGALAEGLA